MAIYINVYYRRFEEEQAEYRKLYEAAGMTEEQIAEMLRYDKKTLAREIAYKRKTSLFLDIGIKENKVSEIAVIDNFITKCKKKQTIKSNDRYSWVGKAIEAGYGDVMRKFDKQEIEILTMKCIENLTYKEISEELNITYEQARSPMRKLKRNLNVKKKK